MIRTSACPPDELHVEASPVSAASVAFGAMLLCSALKFVLRENLPRHSLVAFSESSFSTKEVDRRALGWRVALVPSGLGLLISPVLFLLFGKNPPQELDWRRSERRQCRRSLQCRRRTLRRSAFKACAWHQPAWCSGCAGADVADLRCIQLRADLDPLRTVLRRSRVAGRDVGRPARHDWGFDLIGTIGSGWLSDRYDNQCLLAIYYGFRGLALIWLVESNATLRAMSTFAMLYGLDFIATVPPTVKLTVGALGGRWVR